MTVGVICRGPCGTPVFTGTPGPDGLPFTDGQEVLTAFAMVSCPLGANPAERTVAGCPHTNEARDNQQEERPARLRQLVRAIRDRAPRAVRLTLPALAIGVPVEIPVTWPVPVPDNSYSVLISQEFAALVLLGAIRTAVKPGSRTTTGCTLLVAATRDVADGQAGLHVVAIP